VTENLLTDSPAAVKFPGVNGTAANEANLPGLQIFHSNNGHDHQQEEQHNATYIESVQTLGAM
jgi:hypothetical protein